MEWVVYSNSGEKLQTFIGVILILVFTYAACAGAYYWITDKIKKRKNKL